METHTHLIQPMENGEFDVYPGTQMAHTIHVFLSSVLKIPSHKFNVKVLSGNKFLLIQRIWLL